MSDNVSYVYDDDYDYLSLFWLFLWIFRQSVIMVTMASRARLWFINLAWPFIPAPQAFVFHFDRLKSKAAHWWGRYTTNRIAPAAEKPVSNTPL
jgi:hypothetical protein